MAAPMSCTFRFRNFRQILYLLRKHRLFTTSINAAAAGDKKSINVHKIYYTGNPSLVLYCNNAWTWQSQCHTVRTTQQEKKTCYRHLISWTISTNKITHTMAFDIPVMEHWLEREIAQWVHHDGSIKQLCVCHCHCLVAEARCSSVVRRFDHGAMGRWIELSSWTHWAISCSNQCSITGVSKAMVCVILFVKSWNGSWVNGNSFFLLLSHPLPLLQCLMPRSKMCWVHHLNKTFPSFKIFCNFVIILMK